MASPASPAQIAHAAIARAPLMFTGWRSCDGRSVSCTSRSSIIDCLIAEIYGRPGNWLSFYCSKKSEGKHHLKRTPSLPHITTSVPHITTSEHLHTHHISLRQKKTQQTHTSSPMAIHSRGVGLEHAVVEVVDVRLVDGVRSGHLQCLRVLHAGHAARKRCRRAAARQVLV